MSIKLEKKHVYRKERIQSEIKIVICILAVWFSRIIPGINQPIVLMVSLVFLWWAMKLGLEGLLSLWQLIRYYLNREKDTFDFDIFFEMEEYFPILKGKTNQLGEKYSDWKRRIISHHGKKASDEDFQQFLINKSRMSKWNVEQVTSYLIPCAASVFGIMAAFENESIKEKELFLLLVVILCMLVFIVIIFKQMRMLRVMAFYEDVIEVLFKEKHNAEEMEEEGDENNMGIFMGFDYKSELCKYKKGLKKQVWDDEEKYERHQKWVDGIKEVISKNDEIKKNNSKFEWYLQDKLEKSQKTVSGTDTILIPITMALYPIYVEFFDSELEKVVGGNKSLLEIIVAVGFLAFFAVWAIKEKLKNDYEMRFVENLIEVYNKVKQDWNNSEEKHTTENKKEEETNVDATIKEGTKNKEVE